jgi:predicted DNA-binding transcriptional regulator YafY
MGKVGNSLLMLKLLQGGKKYSIKELAELLEVTPIQVRKYKNDFEKAGIYIDCSKIKGQI